MSKPIEIIQSIYAAFGRGDIPAILEVLHEDVRWDADVVDHGIPWVRPRRGKQAVVGFFETLSQLEFKKFNVRNLLVGGNQVAAVIDLELVVKATGRSVSDVEVHLWTLDDAGRVTAMRHLIDTHQHLAAVG